MQTIESNSVDQTIQAGFEFAGKLEPGDVVCLYGELGAGKTQFVKGVAAFFKIDAKQVTSPTFTLIHEYPGSLPVFHFDCYRLKNEQEALEIGAEEYFYGEGVSLIEWPEKITGLIPKTALHVDIVHSGKEKRQIRFR